MSYNAVACKRNCLHCNTDSDFSSGRRMNYKYCSISQKHIKLQILLNSTKAHQITNIAQQHKNTPNYKYCSIAQNSTSVIFSLRLFSRYAIISRHVGNYWMQKCEEIVTGETQDITCCPAPGDIEGENMVLKTLQMFEAPYCFWRVLLKARNSNKNAQRGGFHNIA